MRYFKHTKKVVGIALASVLLLIIIHDLHPLAFDTHGKNMPTPVSTESPLTDHSEECDGSAQCDLHVLEYTFLHNQIQTAPNFCSSIRVIQEQKPESVNTMPNDHPPEA